MDRKARIMAKLNPKVKHLGFNRKELQGLASKIDGDLELEEDASDEDQEAAIEKAVNHVASFMEITQSYGNRLVSSALKSRGMEETDEEEEGEEPKPKPAKKRPNGNDDDDLRTLLRELKEEVTSLKKGKVADSRAARMQELTKNAGTTGKMLMGQFARMNFKDDDDFEEYYSEMAEAVKGLSTGPTPGGTPPGSPKPKGTEAKGLTDAEIEAL